MATKTKLNKEHINKIELDQLDRKERYTLFGLTVPYLALVLGLIIIPIGFGKTRKRFLCKMRRS